MTLRPRCGFTMVELMIGLVLTLAVGGVAYQMLLRSNRVTRAQTEHIGVQDNVRSGALIISNELREIGYDIISAGASGALGYVPAQPTRTDLLAIGPTGLTYHATRGLGFVCQVTTATSTIVVRRSTWQELRAPKLKDTLMLYVENAPNTSSDDAWVHLGITAVGNGNCPTAPTAGISFQLDAPAGLNLGTALNAVVVGGPARLTEVMRMQHYVDPDDGKPYLGMYSLSADEISPEPVIGPLATSGGAAPGLTFTYHRADNATTTVPAEVRAIALTLRGVTDQAVHGRRSYATIDTLGLTTRVALRNTLR